MQDGKEDGRKDAHAEDPPVAARVKALEAILLEKGLVDRAALDAYVDTYENKVGPRNGARVVAKAWTDPAYLEWLRPRGAFRTISDWVDRNPLPPPGWAA